MTVACLYSPSQFAALRPLEPGEAQRVLLEAHRRVRAGSWYRSRLAWMMIAWAIVPWSVVFVIAAVLPWTLSGAWLFAPIVVFGLVTVFGMNASIRRAYAETIDRILAERVPTP